MPRFTKAQKEKYIKQYEECMREKYGGVLAGENNCLKSQLEQAKEIIRMVIDSYNHKERFSFEKDLVKAEQFLKDK